jgi:hypothetical protein
MRRRGVTYKELSALLAQSSDAEAESEQTLINKVNRGRFSFAFFVRACRAMGVSWVDVSASADPDSLVRFASGKSSSNSPNLSKDR